MSDIFPYEYITGGYFRKKGVPRGKKAETLHGEEAVKYLIDKLGPPLPEKTDLGREIYFILRKNAISKSETWASGLNMVNAVEDIIKFIYD